MRILDQNGNEIKEYDNTKGYLKEDKHLIKHHEATEAREEQWHWETVAIYPNGGKDVEKVVDVEAIEAQEAYDEYEDILRFVSYTEKELYQIEITQLKEKLFETDYVVLKIMEGTTTLEKCSEVIAQRVAWRKRINELELLCK